jgi:ankyrin repeat protein
VAVYLARGIDPLKGKSNDGRTPLHHAARSGILGSVNLLVEHVMDAASFDVKDNEELTPLQDAVTTGSIDVTEALLATSKCDLNQKNTSGNGLVAIAADADNIEMIELLLSKGAEVQPALADRLLKMAAVNGSSSLATTMLEKYPKFVDLSKEDEHGWTSEMFARALGNTEVVDAIKAAKGYDNRFTPDMLSPSEWSEAMKASLLELDGSRLVVKDTTGEDDVGKWLV